jgi:hypothetical protein
MKPIYSICGKSSRHRRPDNYFELVFELSLREFRIPARLNISMNQKRDIADTIMALNIVDHYKRITGYLQ